MASAANQKLAVQLADFDELMHARDTICPNHPGRPAQRQGAAILRASVLLLSAALESYFEDVFDAGVDLMLAGASVEERTQLKKNTSGRFNNPGVFKVNMLFFNLGIPWIMQSNKLRWQKFSNQTVRNTLDALVTCRNRTAHGNPQVVRKRQVVFWRQFVPRLADKIDEIVADAVEDKTGNRPW